MIRIRVCHYYHDRSVPTRLATFDCTYNAHPVANVVPQLDGWRLDICIFVEERFNTTFFALFDHNNNPITSIDATTQHGGAAQRAASRLGRVLQRTLFRGPTNPFPNGPPLTLDCITLNIARNYLTTNRTFDIIEVYPRDLVD